MELKNLSQFETISKQQLVSHIGHLAQGNPLATITFVIFLLIVAPFVENLMVIYLFQGVFLTRLTRALPYKFGVSLRVILTTGCFMLLHVQTLSDFTNFAMLRYLILALFPILYERRHNLMETILPHIGLNALGLACSISFYFDRSISLGHTASLTSVFKPNRHLKQNINSVSGAY
ncbi:CPBP family intramembrane metalloprotease [Lactobacillus sp. CC-MHH1034]|uniref:CPBP family intramembrane glutamic endopeptidase n=1 Tax=Agrilactobacillus fermenti TaxID=2586909 RepID=UPI001E2FC1BC|nr:CPBP family intramembrane glutamic endopeptidase [Agrilactobacillus fermenti]MCD2257471.1 CPBP family intramembrane metalloprotease [Agrilactobacillus fermenti]